MRCFRNKRPALPKLFSFHPLQKLLQKARHGVAVEVRLLNPFTINHFIIGMGKGEAVEVGMKALVGELVTDIACNKLKIES